MVTNEVQLIPNEAPIRRVRRPLFLVGTVLLLVIVLALADWWQAKHELDHLLDGVAVSKIALAKGYFSVNPGMKDSSAPVLEAKCITAAADVQDTGAQVREVFVLPWHRSLAAAQVAYSAHSETWQRKFTACADDATKWSDGSTSAQIDASGRVAHRAFANAVPAADESGRSRVEAMFKNNVTGVEWGQIVKSLVG